MDGLSFLCALGTGMRRRWWRLKLPSDETLTSFWKVMALSCDRYGFSLYKAEYSSQDVLLSVIFITKSIHQTFSRKSTCMYILSQNPFTALIKSQSTAPIALVNKYVKGKLESSLDPRSTDVQDPEPCRNTTDKSIANHRNHSSKRV